MKNIIISVLLSVLLIGCASHNKIVPVGIDEVVKGIEGDIKQLGYLSISDMLGENPDDLKSSASYIKEKQCFFNKSNPMLVFALNSQMTLELNGVFVQSGGFKISGIPMPAGEISAGASSETGQKVSWPVSISSLSALPDQYLAAKLKLLESTALSTNVKNPLEKEVIGNYKRLKKIVKQHQESFSRGQCSQLQ